MFVAKLTDAGSTVSPVWAQRAGGTGTDISYGLTLSGTSVQVVGAAMAPASFGNQVLTHPLRGVPFGFLASLTDNTLLATTTGSLLAAGLRLYPNPAHAQATLQLPPIPNAPAATFILTDVLGRAVRTHTVALPTVGLRHELDLTGFAPGIYVLHVQAGAATAVRQLVVE